MPGGYRLPSYLHPVQITPIQDSEALMPSVEICLRDWAQIESDQQVDLVTDPDVPAVVLEAFQKGLERRQISHTVQVLPGEGDSAGMLAKLAEALDGEIARWEIRARDDAEARSVLRAFLGLRELLWEFGIRVGDPPTREPRSAATRKSARPAARSRKKVQRIRVQH